MPPRSFDEDAASEWAEWVLDHGLPELPETVRVGDSVPIAYWAGPKYGAVVTVEWSWSDDHTDDYPAFEVETFRRTGDGWEPSGMTSGADWFDPPLLVRPDAHARFVEVTGVSKHTSLGWSCGAVDGTAGADDAFADAVVRVLDRNGQPLLEYPVEASRPAPAEGEERGEVVLLILIRLAAGEDGELRYDHVVVVARDPAVCEPPFSPNRCEDRTDR